MVRFALIYSLLLLISTSTAAESSAGDRVRVNNTSDPNADYAIQMLELALRHSGRNYSIEVDSTDFTKSAINEEVRLGGRFDVTFSSSSQEMEQTFAPIRIPLFKGLLGYRIFIIHPDNQYKFDQVKSLAELKQLTLGQGRTWGDTPILEKNGFKVIKITKYPGLFHMVEGGRFDAFPRGVHEPFKELATRQNMELIVEKRLMLAYKMPYYFFVAKENHQLAEDIEKGLNMAVANGEFNRLFNESPAIRDVIEKADMKNRRVFHIDNPLLSAKTPLNRAELWFDPSALR